MSRRRRLLVRAVRRVERERRTERWEVFHKRGAFVIRHEGRLLSIRRAKYSIRHRPDGGVTLSVSWTVWADVQTLCADVRVCVAPASPPPAP